MAMETDDSFKKPGAVPFKWEIRPGVPKIQQQLQQQKELSSPSPPFSHPRPSTTQVQKQKLKPPPAGSMFLPPSEPCAQSFRSAPCGLPEHWRFEMFTKLASFEYCDCSAVMEKHHAACVAALLDQQPKIDDLWIVFVIVTSFTSMEYFRSVVFYIDKTEEVSMKKNVSIK
ncbi:SERINE/ARGININE REPETITIVE MATRIX PROTEIN 1 [Salix purpurea]|uniref:SERINE/ARGININE REPETITIVE MATRIX PROTEIN 1 n=1 Tax=Salix purpurea TaxID=77065 RepID=A0A9Q0PC28_SALPP|nr:SERINE/ARGININE REPETITIVE MATRIX PROTEIN 1 [Salix purpurea]